MITDEQAKDKTWCLSRAGADQILSHVEAAAEGIFRQEGEILPVALLWTFFDPFEGRMGDSMTMLPVCLGDGMDFSSEVGKDRIAEEIRNVAREVDAFGVAFVSEVRILSVPTLDDVPRGSLQGQPGVREIVLIAFEHTALPRDGALSAAEIARQTLGVETSPGTLQPWVHLNPDDTHSLGRFTRLLPGANGN